MNKKIEELATLLQKAATVLQEYDEDFWASFLKNEIAGCKNFDDKSYSNILRAFGGAGSLSDVVLQIKNGQPIDTEEMRNANNNLQKLTTRIFGITSELVIESRQNK